MLSGYCIMNRRRFGTMEGHLKPSHDERASTEFDVSAIDFDAIEKTPGLTFTEVDIDQLKLSTHLLRPVDETIVSELVRSIGHTGLLQPILVRRCADGLEIVFGNHRVEACRRLGYSKISAFIANLT